MWEGISVNKMFKPVDHVFKCDQFSKEKIHLANDNCIISVIYSSNVASGDVVTLF